MNYLITGANGQLGEEWCRYLNEIDAEFTSRSSSELDITDRALVFETADKYRPDVIINCAAYTNVDQAETELEKAFLINRDGVKNLVECCEEKEIKLVHYSTDYVFSGSGKDSKTYPNGYPENAKTDPVNVYGKSKRAGEEVVEASTIHWLLIRVSWLCGPKGSNFVNTMLRIGSGQGTVRVVEDQYGSPAYTFDVVEKTNELLRSDKSGIFHITSSGKINWADFADEIFRQSGMDVKVERISSAEFPSKTVRPVFSLLSTKKIEDAGLKILGWKEGLGELIRKRNKRL
ncbi:MAG: dTDP-4-dehydrorhamnose reductase [Balneolaceae bacterium]|nr:MAG: dTDP-4-dehydrorhamnose reductase [Balneolaceae bacterium]